MSEIVFILGAGASRESGAPLMDDFLDVATDLLRTMGKGERSERFEHVFRTIGQLQVVHSKAQIDLRNIEAIFTVLELGRIIQKIPGLEPENIDEVIASLKDLIVGTIEAKMLFPVQSGRVLPQSSYREFVKLVETLRTELRPKRTVSLITFNYDVGIDVALHYAGIPVDYALESSDNRSENAIRLLKLHGSLNWANEKERSRIVPLQIYQYLNFFRANANSAPIPIGTDLAKVFSFETMKPKLEVENEPVIVPPTWNKSDYHQALTNVWSAAAQELSNAREIFVIGYSLPETDAFFRHLYALGSVGDAPIRRFQVLNPDTSGAVDKRFQSLLGLGAQARYEYVPVTFSQAIGRIRKLFA